MPSVELDAHLNLEDDEGRGMARLLRGRVLRPCDRIPAGRPGFPAWVVIDEIGAAPCISVRSTDTTLTRRLVTGPGRCCRDGTTSRAAGSARNGL